MKMGREMFENDLNSIQLKANASLQWLRGDDTDVRAEWNVIQGNVHRKSDSMESPASRRLLVLDSSSVSKPPPPWRQKRLLRPLLTTCGLMLFQRMSGAHAFNFYAVTFEFF